MSTLFDKDYARISHHIYIMKKTIIIIFKKNKYFSSFQKLCQCEIKLPTKIQITQRDNESKLKNTYRINKIIIKGKI